MMWQWQKLGVDDGSPLSSIVVGVGLVCCRLWFVSRGVRGCYDVAFAMCRSSVDGVR